MIFLWREYPVQPKYDNLSIAKMKLVIELVIEIAGSYPDYFFDWSKRCEDSLSSLVSSSRNSGREMSEVPQQPAFGPEVRPVFGLAICDRNRPERIVLPWPTVTRPRRRMKPGQHQAEARPSPAQAAPRRKQLDHQSLVARGQYGGRGGRAVRSV